MGAPSQTLPHINTSFNGETLFLEGKKVEVVLSDSGKKTAANDLAGVIFFIIILFGEWLRHISI